MCRAANGVRSSGGLILAACLAWFALSGAVFAAKPVEQENLFAEQLAAGEFAPAIAAADAQKVAATRNDLLAKISAAQSAVGARRASIDSAGKISDDVQRSNAIANLGDKSVASQGGGVQPDFQSLIDLITSTISPTTWTEVGGTGAIQEFRSGVHIDAAGTARRKVAADKTDWLKDLRQQSKNSVTHPGSVHSPSALRKVSLTRLEREVQLRLAAGEPLEEEIAYLAGLQRIRYIFVYPDTGDIVLAGPAGGWQPDADGREVSIETGRPVIQLNDLVCLLRTLHAAPDASFGCSIDPRPENLAAAKEFIAATSGSPIKPGARDAWLKGIRDRVGLQDVRFNGIDPRSHVAEVLFEADYRMKLVGIGLEEGVPGVVSYLDSVHLKKGEAAPPMDVLRWWFTMNYSSLTSGDDGQAYEFHGQSVQVQSENEFVAANGQRQHTGHANQLNQQFANSFTQHYEALANQYPIYAELQNVFDLSLAVALLETQHIPDRVGWHMTCFGNPNQFVLPLSSAPRSVESVMNHRVQNGRQIIAAVSGGVHADPFAGLKQSPPKHDSAGKLGSERDRVKATDAHDGRWWWD